MKPCIACPFNDGLTAEATQGQNYGCLPTPDDMLQLAKRGIALSCHDNEKAVCTGLREHADVSNCTLLPYCEWYHNPPREKP